ncbi:MAG: phosphate acyltransferase [Candidatus Kapaibacterium sp.]|nr:MAG: phosphate acyltransferase [Candidatus Kapabacteria bacterium]
MFRIVLDAMGGDFAPSNEVAGAIEASRTFRLHGVEHTITLVGDAATLEPLVAAAKDVSSFLEVEHAEDIVLMEDDPATVVRAKPQSSLVRGLERVRSGRADAFISAGNTGAVLSSATLLLGRIHGVSRPTIGAFFPTVSGRPCLVLDVGANAEVKPQFLYEFGVMGSIYAELAGGIPKPRIGLLNIGEEETKGTETVRHAHELYRKSSLNFIGNVEGRDIFRGIADVIVCDGFVGNVVLKFAESIMPMLKAVLRAYSQKSLLKKVMVGLLAPFLRRALADFDYQKYGGVPLLGVRGIVIIGHGKSSPLAIKNMIIRAWEMHRLRINERIEQALTTPQSALSPTTA